MNYVGIDIGSTSAKVIAINEQLEIIYKSVSPTGWSSAETAQSIKNTLSSLGIDEENTKYVATGYGRISVPYAHKSVAEITCHGKGVAHLFASESCTIIDIGGQDTKIITLCKGNVVDFIMNDKCSAGTGRFLEIMANTLGVKLPDLFNLASIGSNVSISSMCTVFAESEVISLIGSGQSKENISFGVVDSICTKVKSLCGKHASSQTQVFLTGGLCDSPYILESLSEKLNTRVQSSPLGRYAGGLGAALIARNLI